MSDKTLIVIKFICIQLFIITALLFVSGKSNASSKIDEISWAGCGITKKAFMAEIADVYFKETGIKVKISGGGATHGIRATAAKAIDLGGTCRSKLIQPDGLVHPLEKDVELIQVAWDALVAIVHPSNPVDNISRDSLKAVFEGRIVSWSELGGWSRPIAPVTRFGNHSGVGHIFRWLAFHDPNTKYSTLSYKAKSTGPLEKKVARTPTALAIDGVSSARKAGVKIISIDGIFPSKKNIISGKYPLFRPLYLAIRKDAKPTTKALVDFVLSPKGQGVIAGQGTVNLIEGVGLKKLWLQTEKKLGMP
jgi:phosphate transport system substrate-binding protein